MAKDKEKTYTLTESDMQVFARLHAAFCSSHTIGGRLDQVRDDRGIVNLKGIREQSGNLLARHGIDTNPTIHTPLKRA